MNTPTVEHDYLSTGCLHGDLILPDGRTGHEYCQSDTGAAGTKTPAVCKFCKAPCRCGCHVPAVEHECFPELGDDENPVPPWCLDGRVFNPCGGDDGCAGTCGPNGDCLDGPCPCDCHKEAS